ncbi:MAG: dodecin domain-containing protein [Chloroflexi bacterium]|nr:dodecin domain-containing protein [Chloroflexota bacterium]
MSTVKIIELSGASDVGWEQAVKNAVKSASKSLTDLICVDVIGWTANIGEDGELTEYRANVKIAFKVHD